MRGEMTEMGAEELRSASAVDDVVKNSKGVVMMVVNSVCGCAAGKARPGIARALQHPNRPDVIGTVVATIKNESLEGRTLLVVQTLNKDLEPSGKPMVAVDSVGAGNGDLVFWCRGKEASFPFKREDTPTDCTIIAIVDSNSHVTQA